MSQFYGTIDKCLRKVVDKKMWECENGYNCRPFSQFLSTDYGYCFKKPSIFEDHRLGLWAEHFNGQFNWSKVTRLPLVPASEPMQLSTNPPSEMQVIMEMGFLKIHKVVGPDGPTRPSLRKAKKC